MNRFRSLSAALVLISVLSLSAFSASSSAPTPDKRQLDAIHEHGVRMDLEFLTSRELGGRYTLGPSMPIVNRYLASRLRGWGYRGAIDGSFLQHYRISSSQADAENSRLELSVQGRTLEFEYGDFSLQGPGGHAEGKLAFVGYGISAPELGHDDYADIDVQGKIVFAFPGAPEGLDASRIGDGQRGLQAAVSAGAKALITLPPVRFARFARGPGFKRQVLRQRRIALETGQRNSDGNRLMLSAGPADAILAELDLTFDEAVERIKEGASFKPRTLDASAGFEVNIENEVHEAANVVGVLEGSDPELKDEYILFSAHQDHLRSRADGTFFPGADDDGSGVVAVLAIARALAMDPPRRSVAIAFHSGEENGLLGSRYNTEVSPAVPLDKIVANLNIDMIGRSRPEGDRKPSNRHLTDANTVYVIGADRISRELHEINERTNESLERLNFDYTFNDPSRPERFYYRSDHWNYAKKGIPIIFFFTGTHEDYHRPSDTLEKIDFRKLTRIARHVFAVGWRLANRDDRPVLDSGTAGR